MTGSSTYWAIEAWRVVVETDMWIQEAACWTNTWTPLGPDGMQILRARVLAIDVVSQIPSVHSSTASSHHDTQIHAPGVARVP
jgi:hypothetical protein